MVMRWSMLVAAVFGVTLIGGARAADQLPDRRAVLPATTTPETAPAPDNQAVLELLNDIEDLKSQIRELRGKIEIQGHQLGQMRNSQRQSMVDIDQRLRKLEQRPVAATSGPPAGGQTANVSAAPSGSTVTAPPTATAALPAPRGMPSATEQTQYNAAFALMKQGLYQKAAARFHQFIERNPKSPLADNAQYWIGEAAYVTRDFRTALEEFGKVLTNYPQSPKVPDALLKIGYSHYELGAYDHARETLKQVIARYPNTADAKSAQLRLEKMGREGQ